MTSVSGPEGQIDLNIGGTHLLVIINQHTKCHQNRRPSCKFLIDLTSVSFVTRLHITK